MYPRIKDYGAWVSERLDIAGKNMADLSRETGILYPSLDRILKSSKKGKLVRSEEETISKINKALCKMGVIEDENEAWVAAGFNADGYEIIKTRDRMAEFSAEPPENFADWPQELQDALAFSRTLTPEAQRYVYKLWREQAKAHASIEVRRIEAEKALEQRQREIEALRAGLDLEENDITKNDLTQDEKIQNL